MDKSLLSDMAIESIKELAEHLKLVAVKILEDGIRPNPDIVKFDMINFYDKEHKIDGMVCHSAACAIGHFAVMRDFTYDRDGVYDNNKDFFTWRDFSRQYIDISQWGEQAVIWEWLFSGKWAWCDNSPLGVVARIEHFLEFGVPNEFILCPVFQDNGIYSQVAEDIKSAVVAPYLERRKALEAECLATHNLTRYA